MIKILPIAPIKPYFKVTIDYMIGDADGDTQEILTYDSEEDLEKDLPLILALNKLEPLKGHWGIVLDNYPEKYPGEYIGVSEEEYELIKRALRGEEDGLVADWGYVLYSERDMYFVCFEGINVTYIDENNAEHEVKLS